MMRATCTQFTSAITSATIHRLGRKQRRQHDREQQRREGHHQIGEAHQRIADKPR